MTARSSRLWLLLEFVLVGAYEPLPLPRENEVMELERVLCLG